MLKFKKEVLEHRFIWDEGGDEDCYFICRQPSVRIFSKLTEQNTTYEWDSPPGNKRQKELNRQRFSKLNTEGFMDDKVDYLIIDWGVVDSEGNKIPCTRENKIDFDNGRPDITSWLFDKLDNLSTGQDEEEAEDEKN